MIKSQTLSQIKRRYDRFKNSKNKQKRIKKLEKEFPDFTVLPDGSLYRNISGLSK